MLAANSTLETRSMARLNIESEFQTFLRFTPNAFPNEFIQSHFFWKALNFDYSRFGPWRLLTLFAG